MRRPRDPRLEGEVQAAILGYLAFRGDCFHWRNNTGGARQADGSFVRYGTKGAADILAVFAPAGRLVAIECKKPSGGVLSREQRAWGADVEARGGIYIVARSVDEVRAALEAKGIKP